jgi:LruC domain-containing protein
MAYHHKDASLISKKMDISDPKPVVGDLIMKKIHLLLIPSLIVLALGVWLLTSTSPVTAQATSPNCYPAVSIVKYTNGHIANNPDGMDVPLINPGDPVLWTYKVTNTGQLAVARADVSVTDDQTGVTPVYDHEISGNGDATFDPGEVWLYKASGTAVDLSAPPAGVKVVQGVCTLNGTQPPRTAYVNQGTATIPGATAWAKSSYCNPPKPAISIIKYTNGQVASDPDGSDVPNIQPGGAVEWTYKVTNTGNVPVPMADVSVTDDQTGVTPVYDHEISGNGDTTFDPGEVWLYKASGTAVDLSAPPAGVKVVQGVCTLNGTQPPRTAYVNQGTATIPGATAWAKSSYCNPHYTLYFPLVSSTIPPIKTKEWNVAVGFEDLPLMGSANDYDYNDWITDIDGTATYRSQVENGLSEMTFNFIPHARGAAYDHVFHLLIPQGTFGSDGVAVLTLYDQNHNLLSTQTLPFVSSVNNDFVIFPKTSEVFPGVLVNTIETKPYVPPQRYATLDIVFNNLAPFDLSSYNFGLAHGEGLFFDPYLHVIDTGNNIHRGDLRLLTVPTNTYLWPEEKIRIDKAYPDITFISGNPPTIIFPDQWWLNHNHCVYDGVPCVLLALGNGPAIQTTSTVTTP